MAKRIGSPVHGAYRITVGRPPFAATLARAASASPLAIQN